MSLTDFPALLHRLEQGTAAPDDISALKRLSESAPGHVTAHVALARACELEGRWEEARQSWKQAYVLLPSSPAVWAGLQRTAHHATRAKARSSGASPPRTESSSNASPPEPSPPEPSRAEPPATREEAAEEAGSAPADHLGEEDGAAAARRPSQQSPSQQSPSQQSPSQQSPALQDLAASLPGGAGTADDDLDSLIEELQGARINPTPDDPDDAPAPNLEDGDRDVVSPTLARIYEAQGQYAEAARVHRRLAEERPAEADEHRRQAEALQERAEEE